MKKRFLSLLFTLTLLLSALPAAAALEGEAGQAARTLTALHLLDSVPSAEALKTPVTRVRSTELLVRLYGVTPATRDVSSQEYAISKGWVTSRSRYPPASSARPFCGSWATRALTTAAPLSSPGGRV